MCDIAAGRNIRSTIITNILFEPLKKINSSFIQKCPYKIGNISMINLPISSVQLPPFIPASDYRMDMRMFNEQNVTFFLYRGFGTIKANGLDPLLVG